MQRVYRSPKKHQVAKKDRIRLGMKIGALTSVCRVSVTAQRLECRGGFRTVEDFISI